MPFELLEPRQLLAAELVLSADDGLLSNQANDGTPDVFSAAAYVANTLEMIVNEQTVFSGDSSGISTLAIKGSSDDDSITVDLRGAVVPKLDIVPTSSGAIASWGFGTSTVVELTDFESIDANNGLFDLRIRQDLSSDYAADGIEDRIEIELTDGGTRLLIRVNGVDQTKVAGAGTIKITGSADVDTYVVNEVPAGLAAVPVHVGDDANSPGLDNLEVHLLASYSIDYNSTTIGVPKSGTVLINGALDITYEGLAPVLIDSGGGTLNVNAVDNPDITMLTISDDLTDTMSAGTNAITGDGGFEDLFFINASTVNVFGGAGAETITFKGTDPAATMLTRVNLLGADFTNTDEGDDIFVIETLNAGLTVNTDGGGGNDNIVIASPSNSLDGISNLGTINVTGGDGSDLLQISDEADHDNNTYSVNPTTVTRTSIGSSFSIGYANDVELLDIDGGTGADVFQVVPSTTTTYNLDGNAPVGGGGTFPRDTLLADLSEFPATVIPMDVTSGSINGEGIASIHFMNVEFLDELSSVIVPADEFEPNN